MQVEVRGGLSPGEGSATEAIGGDFLSAVPPAAVKGRRCQGRWTLVLRPAVTASAGVGAERTYFSVAIAIPCGEGFAAVGRCQARFELALASVDLTLADSHRDPVRATGVVSVLDEDPDLGEGLDPRQADSARRHAAARVVSLVKGEFSLAESIPSERGTFGLLLLEGLLLRGVSVDVRPSVDVLGAGDLIHPGQRHADATVPADVRWWALRPARVAVLDTSFVCRMSDHPTVLGELAGRLARASEASTLQLSIVQQPNLSRRLQFMFWHLADRFGRVAPGGAILPLPLCHTLLAWLVGARRPAVSRALKELERAGQVERRPDDTWWLARAPLERPARSTSPPQHLAA